MRRACSPRRCATREEPGEQRHLAERVDASLRAAEELLDGLLDVSRLDAGGMHTEISDFDAGALLRELAAQYAPIAAGRGLDLRVHAAALAVRSDRRLLRRVLQNFIANALRYTRNGRIVLGMRRRGEDLELQVWDTGPGIPEHHMRQIFDEFHRYPQPFDWGEQGLGLGLSICQRISRLLGHDLGAHSVVDHGSMFSITVPRAARATAIAHEPKPALRAADSLAGLRVLCVDNDHEILDGMRALLGRWGVEVITAATVDEALQKIAAHAGGDAGRLPPARPPGWPGDPGCVARRQPRRHRRRAADRRWPRRTEAARARARLPAADQTGEAGLAARLPGRASPAGDGLR